VSRRCSVTPAILKLKEVGDRSVDLAVYDFAIVIMVTTLLAAVWRFETNPMLSGFLTAIIYFNGILALMSKLR
jgi:hypothetical protein